MKSTYHSPKENHRKDKETCLIQFHRLLSESLSKKQIKAPLKENINRSSLSFKRKTQIPQDLQKLMKRMQETLTHYERSKQLWENEKQYYIQQLQEKNQIIQAMQNR